jgi:hypothetical protein
LRIVVKVDVVVEEENVDKVSTRGDFLCQHGSTLHGCVGPSAFSLGATQSERLATPSVDDRRLFIKVVFAVGSTVYLSILHLGMHLTSAVIILSNKLVKWVWFDNVFELLFKNVFVSGTICQERSTLSTSPCLVASPA